MRSTACALCLLPMAMILAFVASTIGGTTTSAGLRISGAVEQLETTPYQSATWNWEYAPLLRVLPNGESVLAGGSNHLTGYSIALEKRAANGELLWATGFESRPELPSALPWHLGLDGAGNIYLAVFGPMAVLKYNGDGQLLWSRSLPDPDYQRPYVFAVDAQGNSVMAHGFGITRYNHAGNLQWTFPYPRSTNEPMFDRVGMAINDSGETYLGTSVSWAGGSGSVRVELRKFDSTGALLWMVPYAQLYRYYELYALAVDAGGNLIAAGFGSPPGNTPSERQMFVQKYSPGGQKIWETRLWKNVYGGGYGGPANLIRMVVGPGNEITILTTGYDYWAHSYWGEHAEVTRLRPDGQVRYRTTDTDLVVFTKEPLALDNFGNAYVTGSGVGAATAKYDAAGQRHWLANYQHGPEQPCYGLAVGVNAAGDIQVLVKHDFQYLSEHTLVHYRQRDPTNTFRLQLIAGTGGTFHLSVPTQEPFRIEASADLQTWNLLSEAETQRLLQPGAISFADLPKRFFRVIFAE